MADDLAADDDRYVDDVNDEDGGADQPPLTLIAAGLLGAALGAGLGLLASRALAAEAPSYGEQARRHAARAGRDAARAGRDVTRRVERVGRGVRRGSVQGAEDALETVAAAARALVRTRAEVGERVDRELRALRKLVRRSRRRGWLR